jgi:hypothetical protein
MSIDAKIEGKDLIVKIDTQEPTPSATGKTLVVAISRGNIATTCLVNGKPVVVGLNACIRNG